MAIFIILAILAFLLFGPVGLIIVLILALPVFLVISCGKDVARIGEKAREQPKVFLVALVLWIPFMIWLFSL